MKWLNRFNDSHINFIVWTLRVLVGVTFVFSGFAKSVDPWGFFYKIEDYLAVWHIGWVSREVLLIFAAALSLIEFCTGVLILTGSMRRGAVVVSAAMMAVMLPLTAYILLANPVADCGCFGDAWVISNTATFLKNIALSAAIIYLLKFNKRVTGIIDAMVQWVAMVSCAVYCIALSIVGYFYQPMMDFRPYPVGSRLVSEDSDNSTMRMLFEKDGEKREFDIESLPDSTWTFVERINRVEGGSASFAVFDGDEDVTSDVITSEGPEIILLVPDPKYHNRARASMANNLNDYISRKGGSMIGVVGMPADSLDNWSELTSPEFDVYTSDDTAIKEVARGAASLVYIEDGVIQWKRSIYSLPGDFPDFDAEGNELEDVYVVDSGKPLLYLTAVLAAIILLLVLLSIPSRLKKSTHINSEENVNSEEEVSAKNS